MFENKMVKSQLILNAYFPHQMKALEHVLSPQKSQILDDIDCIFTYH